MLACLYDVHGNVRALEAVLADAEAAGAAAFALGGDLAALGPEPEEVLARLDALDVTVRLAGNWERWAAAPDQAPDDPVVRGGAAAVREALGPERIAAQAAWAWTARVGGAVLVHASPVSDVRGFGTQAAGDDAELLGDVDAPLLVVGHTHLAFRRAGPGGVEILNPGSVGMPLDGDPRAAYALVDDDGRWEHRRVAYDHAGAAAALRHRYGHGWADVIARRVETAAV
jgi:diadenosine tetraphosphatase ApaH/serine/threonine PP2A family protein phosphatase